jgi:hypothetical protein
MHKSWWLFWHKLTHWEHWPFGAVYGPILWYYGWLALRARSFFFFSAANPNMENAGFLMESKYRIYQQLPPGTYPPTWLLQPGPVDDAQPPWTEAVAQLGYPLIAKPDIGGRGRGVVLIKDEMMLRRYHAAMPVPYLLQQVIPYSKEVGIFYVRMPGQPNGRITGIVQKEMLQVVGDGRQTVAQLMAQHPRVRIYAHHLRLPAAQAAQVLAKGQALQLSDVGNHARGARFIDASHRNNEQLEQVINAWALQVPEFHYGRLDVRFNSWHDLYAGRHFMVVELNGAGSEPTHMYDSRYRLWHAWRIIIQHWRWLYRISLQQRRRGHRYMTLAEGCAMMQSAKQYDRKLAHFPIKDFSET